MGKGSAARNQENLCLLKPRYCHTYTHLDTVTHPEGSAIRPSSPVLLTCFEGVEDPSNVFKNKNRFEVAGIHDILGNYFFLLRVKRTLNEKR